MFNPGNEIKIKLESGGLGEKEIKEDYRIVYEDDMEECGFVD